MRSTSRTVRHTAIQLFLAASWATIATGYSFFLANPLMAYSSPDYRVLSPESEHVPQETANQNYRRPVDFTVSPGKLARVQPLQNSHPTEDTIHSGKPPSLYPAHTELARNDGSLGAYNHLPHTAVNRAMGLGPAERDYLLYLRSRVDLGYLDIAVPPFNPLFYAASSSQAVYPFSHSGVGSLNPQTITPKVVSPNNNALDVVPVNPDKDGNVQSTAYYRPPEPGSLPVRPNPRYAGSSLSVTPFYGAQPRPLLTQPYPAPLIYNSHPAASFVQDVSPRDPPQSFLLNGVYGFSDDSREYCAREPAVPVQGNAKIDEVDMHIGFCNACSHYLSRRIDNKSTTLDRFIHNIVKNSIDKSYDTSIPCDIFAVLDTARMFIFTNIPKIGRNIVIFPELFWFILQNELTSESIIDENISTASYLLPYFKIILEVFEVLANNELKEGDLSWDTELFIRECFICLICSRKSTRTVWMSLYRKVCIYARDVSCINQDSLKLKESVSICRYFLFMNLPIRGNTYFVNRMKRFLDKYNGITDLLYEFARKHSYVGKPDEAVAAIDNSLLALGASISGPVAIMSHKQALKPNERYANVTFYVQKLLGEIDSYVENKSNLKGRISKVHLISLLHAIQKAFEDYKLEFEQYNPRFRARKRECEENFGNPESLRKEEPLLAGDN